MTSFAVLLVISSLTVGADSAPAEASRDSLAKVDLPLGISVSLPRDWVVEDAASDQHRFEIGQRALILSGVPSGPGGVLLTASPDGNPDRISIVISVIRRPSADQALVASLKDGRLTDVQRQYREDLDAAMRAEGSTMLEWQGAAKERIGDLYTLVSRYTYKFPSSPPRRIESHRVFLGGGSIGLMLQAPTDASPTVWSTLSRIRDSFHAKPIP